MENVYSEIIHPDSIVCAIVVADTIELPVSKYRSSCINVK